MVLQMRVLLLLTLLLTLFVTDSFVIQPSPFARQRTSRQWLAAESSPSLQRVPPDMEGVPIPFVEDDTSSFIECYADTVATIEGVEYTIGVPCDYSVALCYFDENEQLIPVELGDSELMDDIFPLAESIITEEFGEELVLCRTPQTLTLVGELEEDDEDEFEDDADMEVDDDEGGEEEVEVLLSFEHRGKEFCLVRLLDPILLVGKKTDDRESEALKCILLQEEESQKVMPTLEKMFLEFHDDPDAVLP